MNTIKKLAAVGEMSAATLTVAGVSRPLQTNGG